MLFAQACFGGSPLIDLFCRMFLLALFVFYSAMVVALLSQGVQSVLRRRLNKQTRKATTPKALQPLAFSHQTQRN